MTKEIWKDVKGYEGLYQISNLGNVKTLSDRWRKEKLLKPRVTRNGYLRVCLYKNGKKKMNYVHRLVGLNFIPNTNNLDTIDHINEIKIDNRVENLQWLSRGDNIRKGRTDPDSLYNKCRRLYEEYQEIQDRYKQASSFSTSVRLNSKPALELFNKYFQ